jgi:hypothetical protein
LVQISFGLPAILRENFRGFSAFLDERRNITVKCAITIFFRNPYLLTICGVRLLYHFTSSSLCRWNRILKIS